MRLFLLVLIGLLIVSCGTKKSSTEKTYEKHTEQKLEKRYQELYHSLRDSLVNIPAPKEKSQSHGLMDSYLFTSLAKSWAWIDRDGKLNHTLQNKDSIPTKYIIETKNIYRTDSIYIHKTDTVYVDVERVVTDEPSFLEKIKSIIGDIAILILLILVGIAAVKILIKGGVK